MKKTLSDEEKQKKRENWNLALALQKIDDFEPSADYLELIEKEINGEITFDEMEEIILKKYKKYSSK